MNREGGPPARRGSEAQATHCREGEAGYNVSLECGKGVKSTLDPCWIIRCNNREIKPDMIKNRRIKKNIEAMQFELSKGQE